MPELFECELVAYQISGLENTDLQEINLVTGVVKTIKADIGFQASALAYNVQDNHLYAINNDEDSRGIYKIYGEGSVEKVAILPDLRTNMHNVGAVDTEGYYYIKNNDAQKYFTVDLKDPSSETYGQLVDPTDDYVLDTEPYGTLLTGMDFTCSSWAYNPIDGLLYGVANDGNVKRVFINTGVVENVDTTGLPLVDYELVYFEENGAFYAIQNSDGIAYKMDDVTGLNTTAVEFSTITNSKNNDADNYINLEEDDDKLIDDNIIDSVQDEITYEFTDLEKTDDENYQVLREVSSTESSLISNVDYSEAIADVKEAKIGNVIKSANKQFVDIGESITYHITFRNTGNIPADEVIIIDQIPLGTSYVENSLVSNVGVLGSPLTNITLENPLLAGQSVILAFKVKVEEMPIINSIFNKATIDYKYIVDPQNPPITGTIDTNIVTTEVKHGEIPVDGPDAANKAVDREVTTPGENITYTVEAKNTGNTAINNIIVKDILPLGTSFVAGSTIINGEASGQNPIVGINIRTLQPNEGIIIKFKALILNNAPDKIVNEATINYEYVVDPNLPPKKKEITTNKVTVDNLSPEIEIIKEADKDAVILGEIITYSLEVANNGEVTALDLIIKDPLPEGLEYINNLAINGVPFNGDITLGVNIPSLAPKEKLVISFEAKVIDIGGGNFEFINKAAATYNYQVQPGGTIFSGVAKSNEVKIKGFETSVLIQKNTNKELVKLGDTFTYTIIVKNESELDAQNVLLKDVFPQEIEIEEIRINNIVVISDIEDGILAGPLAKGESLLINILVRAVDQLNAPFKNVINATLFFRPDTNRPVVEVAVSAKDEGIIGRDPNTIYPGVVIVEPKLEIIKTANKGEVAIGEIVKYTLDIQNTGNVDASNVIIRDIINEKLRFIPRSITIDNILAPTEDILLGIFINSIKVEEKIVITFDVEILEEGSIPNQAITEYVYKSETDGINQAGFNESNIALINANKVKLDVKKVSDKDFTVLRDEIKYTVTIHNKTNVIANNIVIKDELPRYIKIVQGSFKFNGQSINTVNLEHGVNIGILAPNQASVIEYKVKVVSNSCTNIIENGVEVSYSYILPDGSLGKMLLPPEGAQTNVVEMGMSNFKQFSIESYLCIPDSKPDIETINTTKGTIDIANCHVIKTLPNVSNEGQYLTGHKLVVGGCLNFVIEYTALNSVQAVHSAHYCIPFSTFVILPEDYTIGSKIDVQGDVEDIYFKLVNEREFFTNVTTLINVKILFC